MANDTPSTFGIRWLEIDRNDRVVEKVKTFSTERARDAFVDRLQEKPSFYQLSGWLN